MKTLIASILVFAFASSALAAGKQQIHYAKPGKNAKKGDIIVLVNENQSTTQRYCDLSKNIVTYGSKSYNSLVCSYIGYDRKQAPKN